eukprot:scaffold1638_cov258-Pinguiococcus_pyrenoidosus.AAC.13
MLRTMKGLMRLSDWLYGFRLRRSSVGGSVASARLAKESMIKLTHRSCVAVRGLSLRLTAPTNATIRAVRFTVSWNCKNLRMLSYTLRPHFTAFTIDAKLSSSRTIFAAFFATSVPAMPIAKPMFALDNAGASLEPSPVTATTSPACRKPSTMSSLSSGAERAMTCAHMESFRILEYALLSNPSAREGTCSLGISFS